MKIVHTADLHIGMETHGPIDPHTGLPRRLEDFLNALDAIVDTAIEEHADLVIMAGDIYKSRDPTPTHQRAFARRVLRLSQCGVPVFLLAGNHDIPNAVSRATSIDIFHELEVPSVTVARHSNTYRIDTPAGPALVASLPWVTRSALLMREDFRGLSAGELDRALVEYIGDTIAELGNEIAEMRTQPGLADAPAILVAHLHAQEARDGAERALTVGTDPLIPINRVAIQPFDYVALGHIHAYQEWPSKPTAVYPGSIERVNFGEETEDKGFVVAEVARGHGDPKFRTLPARRFLTIDVNAPTDDPTATTLRQIERQREKIQDAVVRVRVKLSPQNEALFDESRVRTALAGAFWVSEIYRNVDRPQRTNVAGTSVEGKTPMQLLDDYFGAKQIPQDERERLRAYAARLMNTVAG
jgi:DNA repair protein SbcD/Mre11